MPITLGELVRLEDEYGSLEAAAEAIPEQRDELLAMSRTLRLSEHRRQRQLRQFEAMRAAVRSAQEVVMPDAGDDASEAKRPKSRRKAVPRWRLEKAVELLATTDATRAEVERQTGLSKRVVQQIWEDLEANTGLRWTKTGELGFPEGTRTTPDGLVILPERKPAR